MTFSPHASFDDLIQQKRHVEEARKAVVVTDDWSMTDTLRAAYWKALTGQALLVRVRPHGPGSAA